MPELFPKDKKHFEWPDLYFWQQWTSLAVKY